MSSLPKIKVTADETTMVMETIEAIATRGGIYQRAGRLFEPRLDPARTLPGLLRPAEELKLVELNVHRIRGIAAESAFFFKMRDGEESREPVPERVPTLIHSMPTWPRIPVIESLSENPILRPDGTIHSNEGYDAHTGNYFCADGASFPEIPLTPTKDDALTAFETLLEPFSDFPFCTPCDKSVVVAIMLTMLARPAIPGPTPPFVIRTPTPRTGKDLLTDVMTLIGTGRPAPGRSLPVGDEEELKKLLLAMGLSSARVISFGNCEGGIGSPVLSHVVTHEMLSQRNLGKNAEITVPMRPVWLFNGNNVYFKGDFGPRVVLCNMDAKVADPQARTGWRYDPLLPWVRANRPRLVSAGLTILRAYFTTGKKVRHEGSKKGSFEGWDDVIRGALLWLGVADPLANDKTVRTDSDADLETLTALLVAWKRAFGSEAVTLREAVDASIGTGWAGSVVPMNGHANGTNGTVKNINTIAAEVAKSIKLPEDVKRDLAAAFAALDPKNGDRYTAATLRYALRHHKGRPVDVGDPGKPDVLTLEIDNPRYGASKVASWCVRNALERDAYASSLTTSTPSIESLGLFTSVNVTG